ncbi:SsrA-binding protein SmpB [Candidatus Gottesmanbacteria bacterium]|nr:SsrA-binding protein SmpB [Candidatus Gottesmanbacteria bacterium]
MNIINKKAHNDFNILETYEAGMNLTGPEVKSIKGNHMSLDGAYVKIIGNEIYLVNAQVFLYPYARQEGYDERRSRKLLLHKREIISLIGKVASSNLTLVPLECYNSKGFVKIKIGLAKGKREYEKREKIKRKDMDKDMQRELRGKI